MQMENLIAREQSDRALTRPFYVDDAIFQRDMDRVVSRQWLFVDHVSRIPKVGQYFLFEIGSESIIIVRQKGGEIAAFYNVCRHRGSRICSEHSGQVKLFVCPYHAWTYDLNGQLKPPPYMPADFKPEDFGLESCRVEVLEGLIFLSLGPDPMPFEPLRAAMTPYLQLHDVQGAKLAARRSYPTDANWKLVLENFQECYHCAPSHPLYCKVHSRNKLLAFGAGPGSGPADAVARFDVELAQFKTEASAMGTWLDVQQEPEPSEMLWVAGRFPIGPGSITESLDGQPVAPVMGKFPSFDGGQTTLAFNPFGYVMASNDHFVLIRFTPRASLKTDVEFLWFVAPHAREGIDYDVERLINVWHVTTQEDKKITEDNQAGVLSSRYKPAPYSSMEGRLAIIKEWYLRHLAS